MASHDKNLSKPSSSRGIRTLSDLNRQSGHDSDSDSDGPQEYYTGGEKSGMLVQDPSKKNDAADAIFEKARRLGAVQGPLEGLQQPSSSSSRSFFGTGRLLSGETVQPDTPQQQPENIVHNIVFWRNGFTVDDGPLRRLDDPENAPFLESIGKSECPKELEPTDRQSPIHVNLIRRDADFHEPEVRRVPFRGVGRTLGSSSSTEPTQRPNTVETVQTAPTTPNPGPVVDDSRPTTSIQLRLGDGTRMVARFNHHHTVADIRGFIDASGPGGGCSTYRLQAVGFPPKPLDDPTQTIEQAGLLNSVVLQKL